MEQIAKKLTQYFLAHGLIKEDDAEVCQYALYRRNYDCLLCPDMGFVTCR